MFGTIYLHCPICGDQIIFRGDGVSGTFHHRYFGIICSRLCLDLAERKYATMILGKSESKPQDLTESKRYKHEFRRMLKNLKRHLELNLRERELGIHSYRIKGRLPA